MAEFFMQLSNTDRKEALGVAASSSGRPSHLLEKDVWVVWALRTLFSSPLGEHLVFKGGTSLSKVYKAIDRFSEDVDLTYDIRALIPDLVRDAPNALPATKGEERRWTKAVREQSPVWVAESVSPVIQKQITAEGLRAELTVEEDKLFISYDPLTTGTGYVRPMVMLEFGARSTGEPSIEADVTCDAATLVAGIKFPIAHPRVMRAERTFWEKATAIHVFCLQGRLRGERFARHWHDLVRLDAAGYGEAAIRDRDIATAVANHKAMFFPEKDSKKIVIDYERAVVGGLLLVPEHDARAALADDYAHMVTDGLLLGNAEPFDELMEKCADLAKRANAAL
ncbi:nucleotidyl transferase AbiEii/AbiGii toxin family protein [Rhizobium leguminosarum bv. viciae]|uniref:nucleotidyl transferase AbiEii/AbiGii toxin family protein n=1 Tax=Rhizobium leguminosarum TaxID=384 RepID=UPI0014414C46|nr:nucleotidyl transferase AbiEii/AbiGii toxin family protein [Rhizobium leguminosarum]NKK01211.1 nucleotidyl transferase AbiEii/AbiGii toxin family protein [Rhizobium leguminosarum bv. viciae]